MENFLQWVTWWQSQGWSYVCGVCRGWVSVLPYLSSEHSQSGAALPVVCCVGCISGTSVLEALVSKAGRMPHCPVIKNWLEGRRVKLWKRQTHRCFHSGFILRVSAHPKYSWKLLLLLFTWAFHSCPSDKAVTSFQASILPLLFLWEYLHSPRPLPPRIWFSLPASPAAAPIWKH